jgi:hypothetical protein
VYARQSAQQCKKNNATTQFRCLFCRLVEAEVWKLRKGRNEFGREALVVFASEHGTLQGGKEKGRTWRT